MTDAADSDHTTRFPKDAPIQIASIDPENSSRVIWNRTLIKGIFEDNEISNLPVAIISISGAYRTGKSFLLNFFLMFLRALHDNATKIPTTETDWQNFEWLSNDKVVAGFPWKSGSDRVTTGIWMWGKPTVVPRKTDGKLMAIVLLDTQGAFDFLTTINKNKNIFALSTGLSSVQIYNVSKMFQEDQLQHLALFAQCGQAMKEEGIKNVEKKSTAQRGANKFQNLLVVVRDHDNDEQFPMGKDGGTM